MELVNILRFLSILLTSICMSAGFAHLFALPNKNLPLTAQEPVMKKILQGLNPGGVCIFTTGGLDAPAEKTDAAMGPPMYYSVLGIPETLRVIAEAGCILRHLEYDQHPELHLYLIAQKS